MLMQDRRCKSVKRTSKTLSSVLEHVFVYVNIFSALSPTSIDFLFIIIVNVYPVFENKFTFYLLFALLILACAIGSLVKTFI